ncbi:MAG: helix-turn-helix transcriptional regulator [Clostridia bacterium]|nr:helix-turn-helix transcriptional regulator [Clostridia bacterium]
MQLSDAVQERIINLCKERNITLNKLATNSGLPYSTVFSMFYGKSKSPKLATILHICEGLNIELADFFNDPLFKDVQFED